MQPLELLAGLLLAILLLLGLAYWIFWWMNGYRNPSPHQRKSAQPHRPPLNR